MFLSGERKKERKSSFGIKFCHSHDGQVAVVFFTSCAKKVGYDEKTSMGNCIGYLENLSYTEMNSLPYLNHLTY